LKRKIYKTKRKRKHAANCAVTRDIEKKGKKKKFQVAGDDKSEGTREDERKCNRGQKKH